MKYHIAKPIIRCRKPHQALNEEYMLPVQRHHFRIKGKQAEKVLHQLADKTFLSDWCFPNPKLPDGNELCDLLVVFESTVLIWQVKNLKINKQGELNKREVEKNLRQLSGARRQLFDLKTEVILKNNRRKSEIFNPNIITEVFLISVFLGETPEIQSLATQVKNYPCHVFNREFTEIVLNELDTIRDFRCYLQEKERIRKHVDSMIFHGGEKELLAYYLLNERSLKKLESRNVVYFDEGLWEELQKRPEYQRKKSEDEISYVWDELVDRAHTSDSEQYESIARELARFSRFDRRCLGRAYFDAHVKAHRLNASKGIFRRVTTANNTTICFLFAGEGISREERRTLLESLCFVARGEIKENSKIIGIATEMAISRISSIDYGLIIIPEWGPEDEKRKKTIQEKTGMLTNVSKEERQFVEYPGEDGENN